jgi:hypothetical protein
MMNQYAVITMTEKKGHFEKGVWVEDPVAAPAAPPSIETNPIDIRLAAATESVISAVDDLAKATRDLVATDEGRKHIENSVKETTVKVQKSFDDILARAKSEVDKAKADVEKATADMGKTRGPKK